MTIIQIRTHEELAALGSALTWEGLVLESLDDVKEWMEENGAKLKNDRAYFIKGRDMNAAEILTGNNAYPDDLMIVMFDLNDIENWEKLVIARFQVGGRWLDDILDNNARREGRF